MSEAGDNAINSDTIATVLPVIHVVGIGVAGSESLSASTLSLVKSATLVVGAQRHLDALSPLFNAASTNFSVGSATNSAESSTDLGKRTAQFASGVVLWPLGNFTEAFDEVRSHLKKHPQAMVVVLATGDPLFFGLGRLLLSTFPAEQLMFHPHISSMQLAFSRLKLPWQDATLLSVHGRDEQQLIKALQRGDDKIAVLTDGRLTPSAIAGLLYELELPAAYQIWVCENLGGENEQVSLLSRSQSAQQRDFAPLNVVVLVRSRASGKALGESSDSPDTLALKNLPLIGLPDSAFKGFPDRPTLMTKREVRLLILGAIAPLPDQTIWDIGAGTGSVSVELSRLCPSAQIYAIEKTAIGAALIRHNAQRLAIAPITVVHGKAPLAFAELPPPDRVFIGGSSGQLTAILDRLEASMGDHAYSLLQPEITTTTDISTDTFFEQRLPFRPRRIVLALATLEHLSEATTWLKQPHITKRWQHQLTQINVARSLPVGPLTRFHPLNPVTLITLITKERS